MYLSTRKSRMFTHVVVRCPDFQVLLSQCVLGIYLRHFGVTDPSRGRHPAQQAVRPGSKRPVKALLQILLWVSLPADARVPCNMKRP